MSEDPQFLRSAMHLLIVLRDFAVVEVVVGAEVGVVRANSESGSWLFYKQLAVRHRKA